MKEKEPDHHSAKDSVKTLSSYTGKLSESHQRYNTS